VGDDATGDADGDGFCASDDCADGDATIFPGADELCDGVDNDCAGDLGTTEADGDGDGVRVCDDDCDDSDPTVRPHAAELCDGLDNACNGSLPANEVDGDGDGAPPCAGDCNNNDPAVSPELEDVCGDLVDNYCDTLVDQDCPEPMGSEEVGGCGCNATVGSTQMSGWWVACVVLWAIAARRTGNAILTSGARWSRLRS
jgi:hypothetical protein